MSQQYQFYSPTLSRRPKNSHKMKRFHMGKAWSTFFLTIILITSIFLSGGSLVTAAELVVEHWLVTQTDRYEYGVQPIPGHDYRKSIDSARRKSVIPGRARSLSRGLEEALFCLEPHIFCPPDTVYTLGDLEENLAKCYKFFHLSARAVAPELPQVIFYAYHYKEPADRSEDDYISTQFMIWEALGHVPWTEGMRTEFPKEWYLEKRREAQERRANWNIQPSFANQDWQVTPAGELLLTDERGVLQDFMFSAGFHKGQAAIIADGVTAVWDGGNQLLIQAPPTFSERVDIQLQCGKDSDAVCYVHPEYQSLISDDVPIPFKEVSFSISPREILRGYIEIEKRAEILARWRETEISAEKVYEAVWEEGGLADVLFEIRCAEEISSEDGILPAGSLCAVLRSDASGTAMSEALPAGQYLIKEIAAPDGYMISEESYPVAVVGGISGDETLSRIVVHNERQHLSLEGNKKFEKARSDGEELAAAEKTVFALRNMQELPARDNCLAAGSIVALSALQAALPSPWPEGEIENGEEISEANWLFAFPLPLASSYRLEEISGAEDYRKMQPLYLDLTKLAEADEQGMGHYRFRLKETMINRLKKGEVRVHKFSMKENGEAALAGAKINLCRKGETGGADYVIADGVSDENGQLIFRNLTPADYYLFEYEAPQGYVLQSRHYPFSIVEDGAVVEIKMENMSITEESLCGEEPALESAEGDEATAEAEPEQADTSWQPAMAEVWRPMPVAPHSTARALSTHVLPRTGQRGLFLLSQLIFLAGLILLCRKK